MKQSCKSIFASVIIIVMFMGLPAFAAPSELIVAGNEIAVGVDPTVYPCADYLLNMGAAEVLFKADPNGRIQPYLAQGAKMIDANTWEIELRPEARFWSGAPVTARAVVDSLERSRRLDMKALPYVDGIVFSAISEYTVRAVTRTSNLNVPMNLSYAQLVIHNTDKQYTYTGIDTADYTGMYKISDFSPRRRMTYGINENYWGKKPEIQKIVQEEISDADARALAALSGRYHVVLNIPYTFMSEFKNSKVAYISSVPAANTYTIYLNLNKPQFQDKRVRQALSWGLDRQELILLGAEGMSTPLTTWLGSNPAYPELKNVLFTKYDPDKAAQLLNEAGWVLKRDGLRYKEDQQLTLSLRTFRNDKAMGEAIQIQLARIGVRVEAQHGDYSLIQTARKSGEWDAFIEAWGTFGNITGLLKGQFAPGGSANYGGWNDGHTIQMLTQMENAANEDERHRLAAELTKYLAEESPCIYICPRPELTAVSHSLKGFVPHFRQFESVVNAGLRIVQ